MFKERKDFKRILIAVNICISIVLAFVLCHTVLAKYFIVIEPVSNIKIEATAEKNKKSAGSDIRIRGVKIDGETIPFDELSFDSGWKYLDGLLVTINPQSSVSIEYNVHEAKFLEIGLQKHIGSGILRIWVNDRQVGKLDLYSSDWENITFSKMIAPISITSNMMTFFGVWSVCACVGICLYIIVKRARADARFLRLIKYCFVGLSTIAIIMLTWFQIEWSCAYENISQFLHMDIRYILLNMMTGGAIIAVLVIITNRLWVANLLFSIFCFLVGVVNHYTIKFHGSPLSVLEMRNFRTALNVMNSYKIELDIVVIGIIGILIVCIFLTLCQKRLAGGTFKRLERKWIICNLCIICVVSGVAYFGYISPDALKPKKTIGDRWEQSYHKYGYLACSIELIYRSGHATDMPEGYTKEKVENILIENTGVAFEKTPDVIVILNETFYDLRQITEVVTDIPFMPNIDGLENAIKGYTVVPSIGGRTNATEYELLTSNSLQLMQGITPFSLLDLKNANSIVSHMNQLGYITTGAHSESAQNYFRGRAYPELGFENVHFEADFKNRTYYGNRIYYETDECLYENLISWYEKSEKDRPQFMYLLTIQNHGEWDVNPPENDIVHVQNDFGDYEQQMNEFLSCIQMSDKAFKDLTDYFETLDRPVVICMVGDHSPSFAGSIVDDIYSEEEKQIRLRGTPFVIWANYELNSYDAGYIGMNSLMPLLLESAQINSSPYYDYINQLRKKVPVLTSYDVYIDAEGETHSYQELTEYTEEINGYHYLEYNNLSKERIQRLFDAYR